jgi:ELWxxDGT repeat protein/cysteine-rich repeat protein
MEGYEPFVITFSGALRGYGWNQPLGSTEVKLSKRVFVLVSSVMMAAIMMVSASVAGASTPQLVKDIVPGSSGSSPHALTVLGGSVYFAAHDVDTGGNQLWVSDGSEEGTVQLTAFLSSVSIHETEAVGQFVFFALSPAVFDHELWITDGTPQGTVMVSNTWTGVNRPDRLTGAGNNLFFGADNGVDGHELWRSDGTGVGTVQLADINPGASASLDSTTPMIDIGGILFFPADSSVFGEELWKSDGSPGGTVLVRDIEPGLTQSYMGGTPFIEFNGQLFFEYYNDLWKSDGTELGTVEVYGNTPGLDVQELTVAGGLIVFAGRTSNTGLELWASDGTTLGTGMVKDLVPGDQSGWPAWLAAQGSTVFFRASGPVLLDNELWKTDGTELGTQRVADIIAGTAGSFPEYTTASGSRVYFTVDDGVNGNELWQSDGTELGTVLVDDLEPGASSSSPHTLVDALGKLFFVATTSITGDELWVLDTGPACGDGLVDPGEDCDDGNTSNGDCCSDQCVFEPIGSACEDGTFCTYSDQCDGAGVCVPGLAVSTPMCPATKAPLLIRIKDKSNNSADGLLYKHRHTGSGLGNPVLQTDYQLCVWQDAGGSPSLILDPFVPAGGTCGSNPCWKQQGKTFKYKDNSGSADGIRRITLKELNSGDTKVQFKGKGAALGVPALPLTHIVRVQLHSSDGLCLTTDFSAPAIKNTSTQFKDN